MKAIIEVIKMEDFTDEERRVFSRILSVLSESGMYSNLVYSKSNRTEIKSISIKDFIKS